MSKMFSGLTFTPSGLYDRDRDNIIQIVKDNGGDISFDFTTKTTHTIAVLGSTDKCIMARSHGVPVIRPEWILHCVKMQCMVPLDASWSVGCLTGYTVCCTQMEATTRSKYAAIITKHGGTYQSHFDGHITHLFVGTQPSHGPNEKINCSKEMRKNLVYYADSWLEAITSEVVTEIEATMECRHAEGRTEQSVNAAIKSLIERGMSRRVELSAALRDKYKTFRAHHPTAPHNSANQGAVEFPHLAGIAYEPEEKLYLSKVVVCMFVKKPDSETAVVIRRILQGAGATLVPVMVPQVTHVLLGNVPTAEVERLRELCKAFYIPLNRVLVVDWVFDCYDEKQDLPTSSYVFPFSDNHVVNAAPTLNAAEDIVGAGNLLPQPLPQPSQPVAPLSRIPSLVQPAPPPPPPSHTVQQPQRRQGVFSSLPPGIAFCVPKTFRATDAVQISKVLENNGAVVLKDLSNTSVGPNRVECVWLVQPNTNESLQTTSNSNFHTTSTPLMVPQPSELDTLDDGVEGTEKSNRMVTTIWIHACVEIGRVLPLDGCWVYTHPIERTKGEGSIAARTQAVVVYVEDMPNNGVDSVGDVPRGVLDHIVILLGGCMTNDAAQATHVVPMKWVLDSAQAGHFLPKPKGNQKLDAAITKMLVDASTTPWKEPMVEVKPIVKEQVDIPEAIQEHVMKCSPPKYNDINPSPNPPPEEEKEVVRPIPELCTPKQPSPPPPPPKIICFSCTAQGIDQRHLAIARDAIMRLGGTIVEDVCAGNATHLVCSEPSQRESVLSALAKGIWLLQMSWVDECLKTTSFAPEERYEWVRDALESTNVKSSTLHLTTACRTWRTRRERFGGSGGGGIAFRDMKILLCVQSLADSYKKILYVGGASDVTVIKSSVEFTRMMETHDSVECPYTHILFDKHTYKSPVPEAIETVFVKWQAAPPRVLLVDWITYHLQCLPDTTCVLYPPKGKGDNTESTAKRRKT
eukprot:PhF_6_TR42702/c0_g1_i1/m.64483